jgi:hypothetical protein
MHHLHLEMFRNEPKLQGYMSHRLPASFKRYYIGPDEIPGSSAGDLAKLLKTQGLLSRHWNKLSNVLHRLSISLTISHSLAEALSTQDTIC